MSCKTISLMITPFDTLFFRSPRPFTAGEGTEAESVFPPTPVTVQGMIRSKLMTIDCGKGCERFQHIATCPISKVAGLAGGLPGTLEIKGPWLITEEADSTEWLLPAPLDLIFEKKEVEEKEDLDDQRERPAHAFRPRKAECDPTSNLPGKLSQLDPVKDWEKFGGISGFLTWSAYQAYLLGGECTVGPKKPEKNWWRRDDLYLEELRSGIGMDYQKNRAKDGQLYFARHVRLQKGISLGLMLSGLSDLGSVLPSLANFGGEGRGVRLASLAAPLWEKAPDKLLAKIAQSGRFKLVLTQAAWFKKGWHPDWLDSGTGTGAYEGIQLKWQAARIERPLKIGGWDFKNKDQKPLRSFVPAGSVYYFSLVNQGDAEAVIEKFWNKTISETPENEAYGQIGFGHVLVGTWKESESKKEENDV